MTTLWSAGDSSSVDVGHAENVVAVDVFPTSLQDVLLILYDEALLSAAELLGRYSAGLLNMPQKTPQASGATLGKTVKSKLVQFEKAILEPKWLRHVHGHLRAFLKQSGRAAALLTPVMSYMKP